MIVIRRPLQSSSSSSRSGWCSQMQRPVSACRRIGVNIAAPPEPLRSFDQCSTEGSEENLNRRQQRKQRLIRGLGFRDRHSASSPIVLEVWIGLPGWKEEYMEKASGGTFARTTRNTDEDEGRRREAPSRGTVEVIVSPTDSCRRN